MVSAWMDQGDLPGYLKRSSDADVYAIVKCLPCSLYTYSRYLVPDPQCTQVCEGMKYLHHMGVLHGDLKASNVLVDDEYVCCISDFGQSEIKSEAYRMR